ncbi:DUF2281 domain-containing protein [Pleurocapsa sp. FMAR1]|uniref:DUF2281 domain-containing protein n=1 Tax=Pleurocapsa sp. FMAR1 TaxID=3040204 RepID=UPI0029C8FB9C|nr:DUF2281 domain-containing protein [Pleurocapsa sp. FMAR1]
MNAKKSLLNEIDSIPESLIPEALNFVQYLKYKHKLINQKGVESVIAAEATLSDLPNQNEKIETISLSESALSKDWSTPEEDEAWQHL